jgi:hypothetical protein
MIYSSSHLRNLFYSHLDGMESQNNYHDILMTHFQLVFQASS